MFGIVRVVISVLFILTAAVGNSYKSSSSNYDATTSIKTIDMSQIKFQTAPALSPQLILVTPNTSPVVTETIVKTVTTIVPATSSTTTVIKKQVVNIPKAPTMQALSTTYDSTIAVIRPEIYPSMPIVGVPPINQRPTTVTPLVVKTTPDAIVESSSRRLKIKAEHETAKQASPLLFSIQTSQTPKTVVVPEITSEHVGSRKSSFDTTSPNWSALRNTPSSTVQAGVTSGSLPKQTTQLNLE